VKTGVTVILPHSRNLFQEKLFAAAHVINGFGKTMGTIQIQELGTIETPIVLTNTFSIGEVSSALIDYMLATNEDIGRTTGTVNPVVCECNDGFLNDIRGKHVKKHHVLEAIKKADVCFEEGAFGAGTGMSCYGLKGGIGSASRVIRFGDKIYSIGALVLTNMGQNGELKIDGRAIGQEIIPAASDQECQSDTGSIIIILATDIPLTERQLNRICKRAVVGVIRTGSHIDSGSGEIVIAFTTVNCVPHYRKEIINAVWFLHEDEIGHVFRAVVESTEEAILNSMITAEHTIGRNGNRRQSLKEHIHLYQRQAAMNSQKGIVGE
jgi:D-aminopeptidase